MPLALYDLPLLSGPAADPRPNQADCGSARDVSYASAARSRLGRIVIHSIENASGRGQLLRRAAGYEEQVALGQDFWRVMLERYGLRLELVGGTFANLPAQGPLVVVANHPFGILDGLVMGHILSAIRPAGFRIMAHRVFRRSDALARVILPIDFSGTREAQQANIATRADAIAHLRGGGAVGIFPGGTVATAAQPLGRPLDPAWRGFTARMIQRTGATVVPIWFDGANSRLFQLASHLSYTLRMALLIREFGARVDTSVRLAIGQPIGPNALPQTRATEVMDFLRRKTYELSPNALDLAELGHEFEAHYR